MLLILTLILLPFVNHYFGIPLSDYEWQVVRKLIYAALGFAILAFAVSSVTHNYSQVDKLWSLLPIGYVGYVCLQAHLNTRLILMLVIVTIWGIRLTYNFSRKGAYQWPPWKGEEDYRWKVLKSKPELNAPWKWALFNLFFISMYQNALILLFTLPAIIALQNKDHPVTVFDIIVILCMFLFIVYETVADEQQWKYQSTKWNKIKSGEPLPDEFKKGFIDTGLWSVSRHPNYFAEQMIWASFYLFSVSSGGPWLNWSFAGSLLLILLFQGSAQFSEEISAGKYPEYKEYQKRVSRFIPRI